MSATTSERVRQVLAGIAPEAADKPLDPAVNFRDQLEFDSVDFLEFAVALGREFGREIPESDYPRLSSLAGCVEYLTPRTASPSDSRGSSGR